MTHKMEKWPGAIRSNFVPCNSKLTIPTDLASFLELLRLHGHEAYGLIFAFAASHNMLFTLFAGYASSSGALDIGTLIAVVWAGSFLGDAIRFWIGRRFGIQWLLRFPRLHRTSQIVVRLVDRYYLWLILFHRYPHGIRGVAGFAYGMSRLPWHIFLAFNFVAAGLWSGTCFGASNHKKLSSSKKSIEPCPSLDISVDAYPKWIISMRSADLRLTTSPYSRYRHWSMRNP